MLKSALIAWLLLLGPLNAQDKAPPAKELIEYIQLARKAGLTDGQIRDNAVKVGWPAEAVADAITLSAPAPSSQPNPSAPPKTQQPPPAANPSTPAPVGGASPAAPATTPGNAAKPEASPPKPPSADDYQIGEGDVLQISVWGEPAASLGSVVVRPDGKISIPLIKDVAVAGLTPLQVEKVVTDQLAEVIQAPNVTVVVTQINSKKIYLLGAIKKEGPISYSYRMTVMQAISEAGGLTDYAKRKKIYVLRNENGKQYQLPFDYDAVVKGQHIELNIPLTAGDTIVVPH
jgi:polysaccharide export outer membrane protein